jgi:hypothetical protein
MPPDHWVRARAHLEERLRQAALAAPKQVKDIPAEDYRAFFDQLPIHESLRGFDFTLVRNNLRVNLVRAYETFAERTDVPALRGNLQAGPPAVTLPHVGRAAGQP